MCKSKTNSIKLRTNMMKNDVSNDMRMTPTESTKSKAKLFEN